MSKAKLAIVALMLVGFLLPMTAAQAALPKNISVKLGGKKIITDDSSQVSISYKLTYHNGTNKKYNVCGYVDIYKASVLEVTHHYCQVIRAGQDLGPVKEGPYGPYEGNVGDAWTINKRGWSATVVS